MSLSKIQKIYEILKIQMPEDGDTVLYKALVDLVGGIEETLEGDITEYEEGFQRGLEVGQDRGWESATQFWQAHYEGND